MELNIKFSKYMEGQQVSAYNKKDAVINGVVRIKNGKKYILAENGIGYLMTDMKKIKQVGRRLNEEAEMAYKDSLNKFSDYYNQTFDVEKVEKANDNVKEKIVDQYIDSSDDPSVKNNKDAFKKDALNSMSVISAEEKIEKGVSTVDSEIEKLKKENETNEIQESYFDNKRIQRAILNELEIKASDSADYLQPRKNYGMGEDNREKAIEYCSEMISNETPKETVIETLQLDFEISKDEAEKMYDDLIVDFNDENPVKDEDYQDDIEDLYEKALDEVPDELYGKDALIEYLGKKFDVDYKKALNESNDIGEAILNLIDQTRKKIR